MLIQCFLNKLDHCPSPVKLKKEAVESAAYKAWLAFICSVVFNLKDLRDNVMEFYIGANSMWATFELNATDRVDQSILKNLAL